MKPERTPDGRYIVHVGRQGPRLWRATNPDLSSELRQKLTSDLMKARRAVRAAENHPDKLAKARAQVDAAKRALGERGKVWWSDGAPDLTRRPVRNSPYAEWWNGLKAAQLPQVRPGLGRKRPKRLMSCMGGKQTFGVPPDALAQRRTW